MHEWSCCVDVYGGVHTFETILEQFKGTKDVIYSL